MAGTSSVASTGIPIFTPAPIPQSTNAPASQVGPGGTTAAGYPNGPGYGSGHYLGGGASSTTGASFMPQSINPNMPTFTSQTSVQAPQLPSYFQYNLTNEQGGRVNTLFGGKPYQQSQGIQTAQGFGQVFLSRDTPSGIIRYINTGNPSDLPSGGLSTNKGFAIASVPSSISTSNLGGVQAKTGGQISFGSGKILAQTPAPQATSVSTTPTTSLPTRGQVFSNYIFANPQVLNQLYQGLGNLAKTEFGNIYQQGHQGNQNIIQAYGAGKNLTESFLKTGNTTALYQGLPNVYNPLLTGPKIGPKEYFASFGAIAAGTLANPKQALISSNPLAIPGSLIRTSVGLTGTNVEAKIQAAAGLGVTGLLEEAGSGLTKDYAASPVKVSFVKETLPVQPSYGESFFGIEGVKPVEVPIYKGANLKIFDTNYPLVGIGEGNQIIFGSPKVSETPSLFSFKEILPSAGTTGKFRPGSSLESSFLGQPETLKALSATKSSQTLVPAIEQVTSTLGGSSSIYLGELPDSIKVLQEHPTALNKLIELFRDKEQPSKVLGSFAMKPQLAPEFQGIKPGDIEPYYKTLEQGQRVALQAKQIFEDEGINTKITGKKDLTVQVEVTKPNGEKTYAHAVDIHIEGEEGASTESGLLFKTPSREAFAYGGSLKQPTINIEGLKSFRLSEQLVRKIADSVGNFRVNDAGELIVGPSVARGKDIADAYYVGQTLLRSRLALRNISESEAALTAANLEKLRDINLFTEGLPPEAAKQIVDQYNARLAEYESGQAEVKVELPNPKNPSERIIESSSNLPSALESYATGLSVQSPSPSSVITKSQISYGSYYPTSNDLGYSAPYAPSSYNLGGFGGYSPSIIPVNKSPYGIYNINTNQGNIYATPISNTSNPNYSFFNYQQQTPGYSSSSYNIPNTSQTTYSFGSQKPPGIPFYPTNSKQSSSELKKLKKKLAGFFVFGRKAPKKGKKVQEFSLFPKALTKSQAAEAGVEFALGGLGRTFFLVPSNQEAQSGPFKPVDLDVLAQYFRAPKPGSKLNKPLTFIEKNPLSTPAEVKEIQAARTKKGGFFSILGGLNA